MHRQADAARAESEKAKSLSARAATAVEIHGLSKMVLKGPRLWLEDAKRGLAPGREKEKMARQSTWRMCLSSLALSAGWLLVSSPAAAEPTEFVVPESQRQLLLTDHGIAKRENLQRILHQPVKRGAVIRSPDPKKTVQTRTAPVWDPEAKLYKLWVLGIDQNLWQSPDGLHWIPGPKTNMHIGMVVYDARDPDPARRFKAPLLNQGFAVSPDGVHWKRVEVGRIQSFDEGNFSLDTENGLFVHTVKRGSRFGRALAIATSRDFSNWDDLGVVFGSDERDQELAKTNILARFEDKTLQHPPYNDPAVYRVDVYNMGVFRYEGLYIGMPAMYHATGPVPNYPNTVGFHLVQLACSRDLQHWDRLGDRQPFIGPSKLESGAYDLTQILPASTPILRDDELWFYYTGLKWRGSFTYVGTFPNGEYVPIPGKDRDGGAICLAVLRRDGFVSLDAGNKQGILQTQPFQLPAENLRVNANLRGGELQVEVLGEAGTLLATSDTTTGDQLDGTVSWQGEGLAGLAGKTVSLRFRLRVGSLYSYWLTD